MVTRAGAGAPGPAPPGVYPEPPGLCGLRTLMKLLPWEIIHVSGFALAGDLSSFSMLQAVGISIGNILTIAYLATALATRGRYSVHDFVAKTLVEERIK
jgi:hypothetical protein